MRTLTTVVLTLFVLGCSGPAPRPSARIPVGPVQPGLLHLPKGQNGPAKESRTFPVKAEDLTLVHEKGGFQAAVTASEAIATFLAPGSWGIREQTALYFDKDKLVVRHSPEVLDRLPHLLKILRANRDRRITATVRFLALTSDALVGMERFHIVEGCPVGSLKDSAYDTLVTSMHTLQEGCIVQPPALTMHHGTLNSVTIANQIAYVKGWQDRGPDQLPDPIIDITEEGARVHLAAIASGDKPDAFTLSLSWDFSAMVEPVPQVLTVRTSDCRMEMPLHVRAQGGGVFSVGFDEALFAVIRNPDIREKDHPILGMAVKLAWARE